MPAPAHTPLNTTLARLAIVLAIALAAGFAVGHPWPALAIGALGLLVWQQLKLRRVVRRLGAVG